MWHEVYAPKTISDVCWSRQKINEFCSSFTLLQQQRNAYITGEISPQQTNIMLCYGPTGCAKTSSIEAILRDLAASAGLKQTDTSLSQSSLLHAQKRNATTLKKIRENAEVDKANCMNFTSATINLDIIDGLGNASDENESEGINGHHSSSGLPAMTNDINNSNDKFTFQKSRRGAGTISDLRQELFGALDRQQTYMERYLQLREPTVIHTDDGVLTERLLTSTTYKRCRLEEQVVLLDGDDYGKGEISDLIDDVSSEDDCEGQHNQAICGGTRLPLPIRYRCNVILVKELPQYNNNGFSENTRENLEKVLRNFLESSRRQEKAAVKVREKIRKLRDQVDSVNANARLQLQMEEDGDTLEIVDSIFIFVHTIHDSHSDKVDLSNWLPRDFFDSSSIYTPLQFHCRAITANSIVTQLGRLLMRYIADIRENTIYTTTSVSPSQMDRILWIQEIIDGVDDNGGKKNFATVPRMRRRMPHPLLVSIAEGSNGDVRNAVLKLQWATLCRVKLSQHSSQCSATTVTGSHDTSIQTNQKLISLFPEYSFPRDETIDLSHATARLLTQKYSLNDVLAVLPNNIGGSSGRYGGSCPPWKVYDYFTNNMPHYFWPSANEPDGPRLSINSKHYKCYEHRSSPMSYCDNIEEELSTSQISGSATHETFVAVDTFQCVTYRPRSIGRRISRQYSQMDAYSTISAYASLVDVWIQSPKQFNGYGYGYCGSGEGWSTDNSPINEIGGGGSCLSSGLDKFVGLSTTVCSGTQLSSHDSQTSSVTSFMDNITGAQYHNIQSYFALHVLSLSYSAYHTHVYIPKSFISLRPPPFMPPCFPILVTTQQRSDYVEDNRDSHTYLIGGILDSEGASLQCRSRISDLSKYCSSRHHVNYRSSPSSTDGNNVDSRIILTPYYATIRYLVCTPGATVEEVILDMVPFTALILLGSSMPTAGNASGINTSIASVNSGSDVTNDVVPFNAEKQSNINFSQLQKPSFTQFPFQFQKPKRTILGPPPGGKCVHPHNIIPRSIILSKLIEKHQGVEGVLGPYIELINLLFNFPMRKISPVDVRNDRYSSQRSRVGGSTALVLITRTELMLAYGCDDEDRRLMCNNSQLCLGVTNFILKNKIETCHPSSVASRCNSINPRFTSVDIVNAGIGSMQAILRVIIRYTPTTVYGHSDGRCTSILSTEWGDEGGLLRPTEKSNGHTLTATYGRWLSLVSDMTGDLCAPPAFGVFVHKLLPLCDSKRSLSDKSDTAVPEVDEIENSDDEL